MEDEVVLCTNAETFKLKQLMITNPLLIVKSVVEDETKDIDCTNDGQLEARDVLLNQAKFYFEAIQITPSIEPLLSALAETADCGEIDDEKIDSSKVPQHPSLIY